MDKGLMAHKELDNIRQMLDALKGGVGTEGIAIDKETLRDVMQKTEEQVLQQLKKLKQLAKRESEFKTSNHPEDVIHVEKCEDFDKRLKGCTEGVDCPPGHYVPTGVIEVDVKSGTQKICLTKEEISHPKLVLDSIAEKRFETAVNRHKAILKKLVTMQSAFRKAIERYEASGSATSSTNYINSKSDFDLDVANMRKISGEFIKDPKVQVNEQVRKFKLNNGRAEFGWGQKQNIPLGECQTAQNASQCDRKRELATGTASCVWAEDLKPTKNLFLSGKSVAPVPIDYEKDIFGQNKIEKEVKVKYDKVTKGFIDPYEIPVNNDDDIVAITVDPIKSKEFNNFVEQINSIDEFKCLPKELLPFQRAHASSSNAKVYAKALVEDKLIKEQMWDPYATQESVIDKIQKAGLDGGSAIGLDRSAEYERIMAEDKTFVDVTKPVKGTFKIKPSLHRVWLIVTNKAREQILARNQRGNSSDILKASMKNAMKELTKARIAIEKREGVPGKKTYERRLQERKTPLFEEGEPGYQNAKQFWYSVQNNTAFYDLKMALYDALAKTMFAMHGDEVLFTNDEVLQILAYEDQIIRAVVSTKTTPQCNLASIFSDSSTSPLYYQLPSKNKLVKKQSMNSRMAFPDSNERVPVQHYVVLSKETAKSIGAAPYVTFLDSKGMYDSIVPLIENNLVSNTGCVVLTGMLAEMLGNHPNRAYDTIMAKYAKIMYAHELRDEGDVKKLLNAASSFEKLAQDDPEIRGMKGGHQYYQTLRLITEMTNSRLRAYRNSKFNASAAAIRVSQPTLNLTLADPKDYPKSVKTALDRLKLGGSYDNLYNNFYANYLVGVPKLDNNRAIRDLEIQANDSTLDSASFMPSILSLYLHAKAQKKGATTILDQCIPIDTDKGLVRENGERELFIACLLAAYLPSRIHALGENGLLELCQDLQEMTGDKNWTNKAVLRLGLVREDSAAKGTGAYKMLFYEDSLGQGNVLNQRLNESFAEKIKQRLESRKTQDPEKQKLKTKGLVQRGLSKLKAATQSIVDAVVSDDGSRDIFAPEVDIGSIVISSKNSSDGEAVEAVSFQEGLLPFLQIAQAETGRAGFNRGIKDTFANPVLAYDKYPSVGLYPPVKKDVRVGYMSIFRRVSDEKDVDKDGVLTEKNPDMFVSGLWTKMIKQLAAASLQESNTEKYNRFQSFMEKVTGRVIKFESGLNQVLDIKLFITDMLVNLFFDNDNSTTPVSIKTDTNQDPNTQRFDYKDDKPDDALSHSVARVINNYQDRKQEDKQPKFIDAKPVISDVPSQKCSFKKNGDVFHLTQAIPTGTISAGKSATESDRAKTRRMQVDLYPGRYDQDNQGNNKITFLNSSFDQIGSSCPKVLVAEDENGNYGGFEGMSYDQAQPSHYAIYAYAKLVRDNALGDFQDGVLTMSPAQQKELAQKLNGNNTLSERQIRGVQMHAVLSQLIIDSRENQKNSNPALFQMVDAVASKDAIRQHIVTLQNTEDPNIKRRPGRMAYVDKLYSVFRKLLVDSKKITVRNYDVKSIGNKSIKVGSYIP